MSLTKTECCGKFRRSFAFPPYTIITIYFFVEVVSFLIGSEMLPCAINKTLFSSHVYNGQLLLCIDWCHLVLGSIVRPCCLSSVGGVDLFC